MGCGDFLNSTFGKVATGDPFGIAGSLFGGGGSKTSNTKAAAGAPAAAAPTNPYAAAAGSPAPVGATNPNGSTTYNYSPTDTHNPFGNIQNTAGNFCGTQNSVQHVNPNYYDPLGPAGYDAKGQPVWTATGGTQARDAVFQHLAYALPDMDRSTVDTVGALRAAAASPGYDATRKLALSEVNGDYLNGSPALYNAMGAMRQAASTEAANQNARTRSTYAQNGMSFGTGNQEAEAANQAAQTAQANQTEAQARLANYQNERQIQQTAPQLYDAANQAPINYLANIPNAYEAPLQGMSNIVQGLAGKGAVVQPDTLVQPGATSQFLGAIGQL